MAETDAVIQQALRDEESERKRAKQEKHAADKQRKAARKGMTLEQIEAQEGGPVKESMVGMAQTKRAAKRKGAVADTDLVEDVEGIEEDLEAEEEDGNKLEAFNLKEEREKGFFDDSGNYVEREDKDEKDVEADAWLQSDEAKVVSEEVRRKIEEKQRADAAAEAAGPITATQIARLQYQAAQVLQPGETVAAGLKRLGGHSRRPTAKRSRQRGGDDEAAADMAAEVAPDPAAKELFNKLTAAAMKLMDAGENDVYSQKKEYFERAASVYIDADEAGPPGGALAAGPSKAAYEDADEDMFGSDDEGKEAAKPQQQAAAPAAAAAAGPVGAGAPPAPGGPPRAVAPQPASAPAADETDYSSWPVKELRRFLTERGVEAGNIVEKGELIAKVKEAAAQGPEGEAPAGYTFDHASGYFYSAESSMFWDPSSGGFYNGGKWYSWDAGKQEFVEWQQQPAARAAP